MRLLSLNVGRPVRVPYTNQPDGLTGLHKRPVEGPVRVSAPGPKGVGGSGLAGDAVCDLRHHGGDDQAVYAFAREDLDSWAEVLGRVPAPGAFGENLTTEGVDVSGALIGERWRVGRELLLEVASGRIPCRTFAGGVGRSDLVRLFTARAAPGAYLRVIEPGEIRAGDPVRVIHRPAHAVTVALQFRAVTTQRHLLPLLLDARDALPADVLAKARAYVAAAGAGRPVGAAAGPAAGQEGSG